MICKSTAWRTFQSVYWTRAQSILDFSNTFLFKYNRRARLRPLLCLCYPQPPGPGPAEGGGLRPREEAEETDRKEPDLRNTVIGIGNLLRADDGIGIPVVRKLKEERPDIAVIDVSTAEIEILEHIRGRGKVIIIDAIKTGAEPGTIHKLEPRDLSPEEFAGSHGLNLCSTLMLGSQLFPEEMPKKLIILAVEVQDITSAIN